MYLMYVDESGDSGLNVKSSQYFILSGLVVHEKDWFRFIDILVQFKKKMRDTYGLPLRTEIHAVKFVRKFVYDIPKHNRLAILRNFIDELAKVDFISITHIAINKQNLLQREHNEQPADIFNSAWTYLFQRFENTLRYGNFHGAHRNDFGLIITDNTDGGKLTKLVRKMGKYNPIPNTGADGYRNMPIIRIVEDPYHKDSVMSLPVQACDVCAYMLMQKYVPNAYVKKNGANRYFDRLRPVLNREASRTNEFGIVEY